MATAQKRLYRLIPNDQLENLIKKNNSDRCQQQLKPPTTVDFDPTQQQQQKQESTPKTVKEHPTKMLVDKQIQTLCRKKKRRQKQRRCVRRVVKWIEL